MKNKLSILRLHLHLVLLVAKMQDCLEDTARHTYLYQRCLINYINHFIRMVPIAQVKGPIQVHKTKLKLSLVTVLAIGLEAIKIS